MGVTVVRFVMDMRQRGSHLARTQRPLAEVGERVFDPPRDRGSAFVAQAHRDERALAAVATRALDHHVDVRAHVRSKVGQKTSLKGRLKY